MPNDTPKCPSCKRAQDVDLTWYCSNCGERVDADLVQRVLEAARVFEDIDNWSRVNLLRLRDAIRDYEEKEKEK